MNKLSDLEEPYQISILTLNLHGYPAYGLASLSKRCELLRDILRECKTTIICFQEVHTYGQLRTIMRKFACKNVVYKRGLRGPAGGLVVLSQIPVIDHRYVPFPKLTHAESSLFSRKSKLFSSGGGVLNISFSSFSLANVHLAPNRDGEWSSPNRYAALQEKQLTFVGQWLEKNSVDAYPTFILGDFNVPGDSGIFKEFLHNTAIRDVENNSKLPTFKLEFLKEDSAARRVDMILYKYKHPLDIVSERVADNLGVSDHAGIRAEIQLPRCKVPLKRFELDI